MANFIRLRKESVTAAGQWPSRPSDSPPCRPAFRAIPLRRANRAYVYAEGKKGFDKETNLHYNGARDYDPSTGRYPTADPLGLRGGDLSLYSYAGGNPLRYADPLGLIKWSGSGRSFNLGAYSRDEYELESECKCGHKAIIKVVVDSLGKGLGAAANSSSVEFEDRFACPNPMAFAGLAVGFNFFVGVRYGVSYNRLLVGAALSSGWSAAEGLGASIGPGVGRAEVTDVQWQQCPCEK